MPIGIDHVLPPLNLSFEGPDAPSDRVDVSFAWGDARRKTYFSCPGHRLQKSGDALFCLGLAPAMEIGVDLNIHSPVDQTLLDNGDKIQDLLCHWYPGYRPIRVLAEATTRQYSNDRGSGVFYSGGVDSSYSLADASDRLDALVTLVGADVDVDDTRQADHLDGVVRQVGARHGLEPFIVHTDIRRVSDRLIGWVEYHGALLAAVRHMLADRLENQLIASSADESSWNRRWGSHPALDPLYGTPGARIEHHGLVDRLTKVARIIDDPVLMSNLRVCDYSVDNCGVCEDCTFMLLALDVLDAFDRAPTFSRAPVDPARVRVTGEGSISDLTKLRQAFIERKPSSPAVDYLTEAFARYDREKRIRRWAPHHEWHRKFKRFKRQQRYRVAGRGGDGKA